MNKYTNKLHIISVLAAFFMYINPAHAQIRTVSACDINPKPANCEELYALEIHQNVPHGAYVHVADPGCMEDATGKIADVISSAISVGNPKLKQYSGSISSVIAAPVGEYLKNQGGDIGKYFSPYAKNGAMCAPIVAVVPADANIVGYRYARCDGVDGCGACTAGADCRWSMFQSEPIIKKTSTMQTATTVFMNWSGDRDRDAVFTLFYKSKTPPLKVL